MSEVWNIEWVQVNVMKYCNSFNSAKKQFTLATKRNKQYQKYWLIMRPDNLIQPCDIYFYLDSAQVEPQWRQDNHKIPNGVTVLDKVNTECILFFFYFFFFVHNRLVLDHHVTWWEAIIWLKIFFLDIDVAQVKKM